MRRPLLFVVIDVTLGAVQVGAKIYDWVSERLKKRRAASLDATQPSPGWSYQDVQRVQEQIRRATTPPHRDAIPPPASRKR